MAESGASRARREPSASARKSMARALVRARTGVHVAPAITTMRGGGVSWYRLSGTQTHAQLLQLRANAGGGAPPNTLRVAVTRTR